MGDLLTPGDRRFVELARDDYKREGSDGWRLISIIDRVAPKPKEFSWAPGHTDFLAACTSLNPRLETCNLDRVAHGLTNAATYCDWVWGCTLAAQLGFIEADARGVGSTEKGKAWLVDYNEWKASQ